MMDNWGPADYVMVISAIFTGIASTIAAIRATKADNKATVAAEKSDLAAEKAELVSNTAQVNTEKLDEIHHLTNGNLSKTQDELELEKRKNAFLEKVIIEITAECPSGTLDKAKKNVEMKEAKIGKRRKNDLKRDGDQ